jgi:hypothetical protein
VWCGKINPMQIANYASASFGILLFLFLFWKRQKEDFSSDIIFKTASHILSGVFLLYVVSVYFFKEYWLWFSFAGGLMGLLIAVFRLKTRFNEVFEAFVIASLPWIAMIFLNDSVAHSSLSSFLGFLIILWIIFISYWLDGHYKNFSWYRSGRIGFSGLMILSLIFLIRFGIAVSGNSVLSFVGNLESVLSGIGFFTSILLLYRLGKTKE